MELLDVGEGVFAAEMIMRKRIKKVAFQRIFLTIIEPFRVLNVFFTLLGQRRISCEMERVAIKVNLASMFCFSIASYLAQSKFFFMIDRYNTWEPRENILDTRLIQIFEKQQVFSLQKKIFNRNLCSLLILYFVYREKDNSQVIQKKRGPKPKKPVILVS